MTTKKIFLIGEIGINHNGNLNNAKKLIKIAKKVGFDAVKFQKRTPEITTPKSKANTIRETPWGKITYLDYKRKIEFGKKEFDQIDKYCTEKGINWFASVWDEPSVDFMYNYTNHSNAYQPYIFSSNPCRKLYKLFCYWRSLNFSSNRCSLGWSNTKYSRKSC